MILEKAMSREKVRHLPHRFNLPTGCTRAEADRLTQEVHDTHPGQMVVVVRFIRPGQARYNYETKEWEGDLRYNKETCEYGYFFPDDPPLEHNGYLVE
jgi:hypothetical protein